MLNINLKKLKAYGDRLDDGSVQLSFTFPVKASPEAKEAARLYAEKLGLEKVSVATMEPMGEQFTFFVVYGNAKHSIDFRHIHVPKITTPHMGYDELKEYMASYFTEPLVVIGAATGADAHTVGIDAIMNMKGFAGDYGLERYPLFKAYNLRSQVTNEQLIEKAVELKADAMLISQVVTQRDSHIKNLKAFKDAMRANRFLSKDVVVIIGGPRIDHAIAKKLGFDAGYGPGTKPSQVASFIVHELIKRKGLKPLSPAECRTRKVDEERGDVEIAEREVVDDVAGEIAVAEETKAEEGAIEGAAVPATGEKKRRRRGRRGGRRRRRKKSDAGTGNNTESVLAVEQKKS